MAWVIPNGGGEDVTHSEVSAYAKIISKPSGDQTPAEQQQAAEIEARVQSIATGWNAVQANVALLVLRRSGELQQAIDAAIRKVAKTSKDRQALQETFAVINAVLTERDRELLEALVRAGGTPEF